MTWLLQRQFLVLLIAMIGLMVLSPTLHPGLAGRLVQDLFLTVVFLAAFRVSIRKGPLRWLALVLGLPALLGTWTGYFLPGLPRPPLVIGFHLAAALFLLVTVAAILRVFHREKRVTSDQIYGALCGYVLLGLTFGHFYSLIHVANPGAFRGLAAELSSLDHEAHAHIVLTYFSFVTLSTVGYGDITPLSGTARGFAVVEAILGQFYIAVLIAEVVAKRQMTAMQEQADEVRE